jgi:hypothetical protein
MRHVDQLIPIPQFTNSDQVANIRALEDPSETAA